VADRVQAIAELGAGILWLLPIHPIGEVARKGRLGSPYAIRDYRAINPEYGREADLISLVRAAHDAGLKVILDCVFNHGAPDHLEAARHPSWFRRDGRGRVTRRVADWHDVVDWDFSAPDLEEHLLESLAYWMREFDIDGFRCDVAGMVPSSFWQKACVRLSALRTDYFLLAEWDDPAIHRAGFHASYDWELYRTMRRVVRGDVPVNVLAERVARRFSTFPAHAMPMRFVENHDEYRAGRRLGAAANALTVFAALAGGCFLVYNGQEVGARHRPNLFDRDPIDWTPPDAARHRAWWGGLLEMRRGLHDFEAPEAINTGIPALAVYRRQGAGGERIVTFNGSARPIDWRPDGATGSLVIEPGSTAWPAMGAVAGRVPARSTVVFSIT
jgi:hypothetical protein